MRQTILCGSITACILLGSPAWGCPYCESDTGKEVAAGIFNQDFALNAALTLLPIPIFFLIVYLIHSGFLWSGKVLPAGNSETARQTDSLSPEAGANDAR